MMTKESVMAAAAEYADDAMHFSRVGSRLCARACHLGLAACEAATMSINHTPEFALRIVESSRGGTHERDIWRTRGAV